MGKIIKLTSKATTASNKKALKRLVNTKNKQKSLRDFYGKLPDIYNDGLEYQKNLRDEWK